MAGLRRFSRMASISCRCEPTPEPQDARYVGLKLHHDPLNSARLSTVDVHSGQTGTIVASVDPCAARDRRADLTVLTSLVNASSALRRDRGGVSPFQVRRSAPQGRDRARAGQRGAADGASGDSAPRNESRKNLRCLRARSTRTGSALPAALAGLRPAVEVHVNASTYINLS